jgi:uncharacterized membrane protein YidH (DUF202 family)
MKKIIGWILILLGLIGLVKSIPGIIEYLRVTRELERTGFYTGMVSTDLIKALVSIIFFIIGFYFVKKKKDSNITH